MLPNSPDVFVIEDALLDYRFKNSPLVLGEPYIRFYAGAAIIINDVKIGSLCIIDRVPHIGFSETDRMNMLDLGAAVSNLVRERRDALLRTNQECAKMMSDMMRKVRSPLCSIALNAETLMTNVKRSRFKHGKSADIVLGSTNSNESSSTLITDVEEFDEETSHVMTNLSTAVAQLNIIIESSICLGDFVLEKVESDKKEWASFTTANILETVATVRKTLKNMEMSTKITWDIDSSHLSLGNRHVFSPKATSFVLLNSVEQLSLHWRNVIVKVSFKDTINEEYECIIQQLDDAPICDIESTWNQGLLEIEFMLSDKRDKSGYEDDDEKGSESSQGYLSFYSLQQVLKDVEGGCTVLDTGSSYAQSMRVWMPCAIIIIDRRANRSIGFDSLSLSTSPESARGGLGESSFPVLEESRMVGINGNDLMLSDSVSAFVKADTVKPIQKKTVQTVKVAELYVSEDFSPEDDNIHDIDSEKYRKQEEAATSPALSLNVDKVTRVTDTNNNANNEKSKKASFQDDTGASTTPTKSEITRIKKLHVLLVEDTLTQQKLMGKWLNGQGCIVTFALNGKVGLELLKTKKFDLCFMDFLMVRFTNHFSSLVLFEIDLR